MSTAQMISSPRTIEKELVGQSFFVKDSSSGRKIEFQFPNKFNNWPRGGSDGFVAPVVCKHPQKGDIPSIVKFFHHELPQRPDRQKYLVKFGLASRCNGLYDGVPYMWIDQPVAGYRIYGYIAKHVGFNHGGDDFRIVREKDDINSYTEDDRRDMAAQLCCAVRGLEKLSITHSDLSPANIVLGKGSGSDAHCILIDYDGFQCSDVAQLPRQYKGKQIRMLGSSGYQHPSLMRLMKTDSSGLDDNLKVENDRFALGVLCYELLTWTTQVFDNLDRTHLLGLEQLERGCLDIPKAVKSVWPEGYKLLTEAVTEPDVNSLPSPGDWLRALGFLGKDWRELCADWSAFAFLKIFKKHGNGTAILKRCILFEKSQGHGDLARVDFGLSSVLYQYKTSNGVCSNFTLKIGSSEPVVIKRGGETKVLGVKPEEITISPGDRVLTDGWVLEFQDSSLGGSY